MSLQTWVIDIGNSKHKQDLETWNLELSEHSQVHAGCGSVCCVAKVGNYMADLLGTSFRQVEGVRNWETLRIL